jgi:hypothetical protein
MDTFWGRFLREYDTEGLEMSGILEAFYFYIIGDLRRVEMIINNKPLKPNRAQRRHPNR